MVNDPHTKNDRKLHCFRDGIFGSQQHHFTWGYFMVIANSSIDTFDCNLGEEISGFKKQKIRLHFLFLQSNYYLATGKMVNSFLLLNFKWNIADTLILFPQYSIITIRFSNCLKTTSFLQ